MLRNKYGKGLDIDNRFDARSEAPIPHEGSVRPSFDRVRHEVLLSGTIARRDSRRMARNADGIETPSRRHHVLLVCSGR